MQGKKEVEQKREKAEHDKAVAAGLKPKQTNEADITAEFDAADDADVVF